MNTPRKKNENSFIIKELKKESDEYDKFTKKNFTKKKEIEIKNIIGISNLQTMIKAIEYEFKFSGKKNKICKCKNAIIILKSKQKAYNIHKSNPLIINITENYFMKYKNAIKNSNIGIVYFKIERFVNSNANYLVFSVLIKQSEKLKDSKDNKNKSKYIVNIEINGQLRTLNKSNKDENK